MDKAQVQKSPSTNTGKQNTQGTKTRSPKNTSPLHSVPNSSPFQPHDAFNHLTPAHLIHLQRTLGNQAVGRIIQAKLTISHPDDPYEREADQVADKVMRMPDPVTSGEEETKVQTKPISSQITPLVHRMPEKMADEEHPPVQAKQEEGAEHDEEAVVAKKPSIQRTAGNETPEEEQTVAPKLKFSADVPIQRRSDEEEESLQAKFEMGASPQQDQEEKKQEIDQSGSVVHRQTEEDEAVQTKALPRHSPQVSRIAPINAGSAYRSIQRLCSGCAEEKHQEEGKPELAQRKPARYQLHDDHDEEEQKVQPKGGHKPTPQVSPSIAADIHALNHGGSPLPKTTRAFFEPRFGVDFSGVRVHTGSRAAETAKSINARAFTVGNNIAFGGGQYTPESSEGRKLLAHELTHVVQQNLGLSQKGIVSSIAPQMKVSELVQREPQPLPNPSNDDPAVANELDDEIKSWEANANQDEDLILRAKASRMVLLLKGMWRTKPILHTREDLDRFTGDCTDHAKTELGTLAIFAPAGVEAALAFYPKGFPLTWSGRVQAALTLGADPSTILIEWTKLYEELIKRSAVLGPEIFQHGLPVPLSDLKRLDAFQLRISDGASDKQSPVRDFARNSIQYVQLKWVALFAFTWENIVNEVASAVADGKRVPNYLNWKDFEKNKQTILRELPTRARTILAKNEQETEKIQTDAINLADTALMAGMVSGLYSLFAILSGWNDASGLFDKALGSADKSVAAGSNGTRITAALQWAWDNDYFSGAAAAWAQNLIQHGPEILGEIALILILQLIPGVNLAVDVYLAYTAARDVIGMIDELASSLKKVSDSLSVGELQKASAHLAQVLNNGAIQIMIVLATLGIAKGAAKIRKRSAELRAADKSLTAEAAEKKALEEMSAAERKPLEEGAAKKASQLESKFKEFSGACVIGSINCRTKLPDQIVSEAGSYPKKYNIPMPSGPFNIQKALLTGVERVSADLQTWARSNRKAWPHFDKALAEAEKEAVKKGLPKESAWPKDSNGKSWEVHHIKPVAFGGGNDLGNLVPLPKAIHQEYSNWWGAAHRAFQKRFTPSEWDAIYWNQQNIPGSKVPKNPK